MATGRNAQLGVAESQATGGRRAGPAPQVYCMSTISSVRVRCSGSLHRISITGRGAVLLHDHKDLQAERAMQVIGGEKCRCMEILDAWRKGIPHRLPPALRPLLYAAGEKRSQRVKTRSCTDWLSLPVCSRVAARTRGITMEELEKCSYRRSQSSWAGGNHECLGLVGKPGISGSSDRVWSSNGKWSGNDSYIHAVVPLTWLVRVYQRGLAVVDGCFVLDVLSEDEKGYTVLAGRQGRGFDVYPCQARVTAEDGSFRLRWTKGGAGK